ncbi:hypothetical protein GCM10027022_12340 [Alpinimonas psychrophila]|uniref:PKD domain-containing protein n=1 Tax=Alpinimonas psychrophila TaxID=748908 RepID=A0A7W3JTN1_9MICO|nr:hypothetical protein [Alpinimonas psychrophila]MBA8829059.1 hypothetical protein [Alpinimonas psychrophila]
MVRNKFLLTLAAGLLAAGVLISFESLSAFAAPGGCSTSGSSFSACSGAQVGGNSVDVWANQTMPGANGGGATWGGRDAIPGAGQGRGSGGSGGSSTPYWSFYPRVPDSPQQARGYCYVLVNRAASCFQVANPGVAEAPPILEAAYVTPVITVADVATFSPNQPSLATEPSGWAVVGLDSNMITSTRPHVVGGVLLGSSAEVRFTPVSFDFTYGDGGTRSTSSPGASWVVQGLPEFSPTSTSHIYSQSGTYEIAARVGFALEYRWGSGTWTPIEGRVFATAPTQTVVVVDNANVLVQGACQQGIPAPGC